MKCGLTTLKFIVFVCGVFLLPSLAVLAQKNFTKTYPAARDARLQLTNLSGTIVVTGWQRSEIKVSARMEAPAAKLLPQVGQGHLTIDVVRDNQGRGDVGNVYFDVKVPLGSTVDIKTVSGNLTVRGVSGASVRTKVTSEGDITLTGISSETVMAENITGDIFFDGELHSGGTYKISTYSGNVNLNIPFASGFRLVATAPSSRKIDLGAFSNNGLNFVSDGRRVIGKIGDGRASLTVTNQRGGISLRTR